jgi:hypothetical protein
LVAFAAAAPSLTPPAADFPADFPAPPAILIAAPLPPIAIPPKRADTMEGIAITNDPAITSDNSIPNAVETF